MKPPGVGGVEHVHFIAVAELAEFGDPCAHPFAFRRGQVRAGETEPDQRVPHERLFGPRTVREPRLRRQRLEGFVQPLVLTEPGLVIGQGRQHLLVGLAYLRGRGHRVQMPERREPAPDVFLDQLQRGNQLAPVSPGGPLDAALRSRESLQHVAGDQVRGTLEVQSGGRIRQHVVTPLYGCGETPGPGPDPLRLRRERQ